MTQTSKFGEYQNCIEPMLYLIIFVIMMMIIYCDPFEITDEAFERPNEYTYRLPDRSCIDFSPNFNILDCLEKEEEFDFSFCKPKLKNPNLFVSCTLPVGKCVHLHDALDINMCEMMNGELNSVPCKVLKVSSCTYLDYIFYEGHYEYRFFCEENTSEYKCKLLNGVFNTVSCPVK